MPLIFLLFLSACSSDSTLVDQMNARIDWQPLYANEVSVPSKQQIVQKHAVLPSVAILESKGQTSPSIHAEPSLPVRITPFRLVFNGVSADVIMRRLAEWAGIRWASTDAALSGGSFTLDVQVNTFADVHLLVGWMADVLGRSASWRGTTVYFAPSGDGAARPSDAYLIRSFTVDESVLTLVSSRFGVECAPVDRLTICVGRTADVADARKFLSTIEGALGKVVWRVIETSFDVTSVIDTLGLSKHIVASSVDGDRWLLASVDGRYLDTAIEAVTAVAGEACVTQTYSPQYAAAADLLALMSSTLFPRCDGPVVVGHTLYWTGRGLDNVRAQALLIKADQPAPAARLMLLVAQESALRRLGIISDVNVQYPGFDFGDGAQLIANLSQSEGWRTLEVTTDGASTASIQQTVRQQGNVLVTDGGNQVIGREDRTVGLNVQFDGRVTATGFAGHVSLRDTVLDGDTERGATCDGRVVVQFGLMARLCTYRRSDKSRGLSLSGLDHQKGGEEFVVVLALLEHETAAVAQLQQLLRGRSR